MPKLGVVCALVLSGSLVAASASADKGDKEAPDKLNLLALAGYSASVANRSPPNLYGVAAGVRAGWTSSSGVYLGALYLEHQGYSLAGAPPATGTALARGSRLVLGGEVGWDWQGPIFVRVYFGVGALLDRRFDRDSSGSYVPVSVDPGFGLWPGVMAAYAIQNKLVVGVATQLTIPGASTDQDGIELFGVVGTRFSL